MSESFDLSLILILKKKNKISCTVSTAREWLHISCNSDSEGIFFLPLFFRLFFFPSSTFMEGTQWKQDSQYQSI